MGGGVFFFPCVSRLAEGMSLRCSSLPRGVNTSVWDGPEGRRGFTPRVAQAFGTVDEPSEEPLERTWNAFSSRWSPGPAFVA